MSNKKYLVVSEVSKKQAYIFKSNKLKENIGASVIIEYITENLPQAYLAANNGQRVYEGGGSSLFTFDEKDDAKNFIKGITTHVLARFPGVEFFMAHQEYDNDTEDIRDVIQEVYKNLNEKKSKRQSVFKRHSYGIEEKCNTTSYPAYKKDTQTSEYLSREAKNKREWIDNDKKESTIESILKKYKNYKDENDKKIEFKFPLEIDKLGINKGESSYVAIVSLDGNKMGKKLEEFRNNFENDNKDLKKKSLSDFNKTYIDKLYEFSNTIKDSYKSSFEYMIDKVVNKYDVLKQDKSFKLDDNIIPIRPIILAGDDVCFVCDARIALECVKNFITDLNTKKVENMQLHACAGICMVKHSYPFDKAYDIAESLCKSSKAKIGVEEDYSLIDWHISQGEISDSLSGIRSKMNRDDNINLHIKPIYIDNKEVYNNYYNFKSELLKLRSYKEDSNNKIRRARDIFPQGKEKTRMFINKYQIEDIFKSGFGIRSAEYGFNGKDCLYFDMIEVLDLFKDLD